MFVIVSLVLCVYFLLVSVPDLLMRSFSDRDTLCQMFLVCINEFSKNLSIDCIIMLRPKIKSQVTS